MSLFVMFILIVSILKLISMKIYHLLYPRDKYVDSIQYWEDLWKCIFISIAITCMILFLMVMIIFI